MLNNKISIAYMMKKYICPETKILKAGVVDFVLEYNVVGASNGTEDYWAKKRVGIEDEAEEDSFWSSDFK